MAFHNPNFWEQRYEQHPELFDWYAQLPQFQQHVLPLIEPTSKILILGGGTSRLPFQLYDLGYKYITVVDFSLNAKKAVQNALLDRPEIQYIMSDINCFDSNSKFDFVFDKGCIDCVLANPQEPVESLKIVLKNIHRLMNQKAVWVSISFDIDREEYFKDAADIFQSQQQSLVIQLLTNPVKKVFYVYYLRKQ
ncbi:Endothelin-converting_enzyme 1 [Hexamita inflata]|uniref:Endothelin-converting enzyme 1 n=1 Tax=Hexamita inflata TaxID=28002 RepID=A0AA86QD67_9EUKA|nr:Endothelin-converting enzyme 1 [Hexamita inflata]CAI9960454.1 Endothelin-converting enzyme 1 [Hexamita inflata]